MAAMVKNVAGRVSRSSQPRMGESEPSVTMAKAVPTAAQMMLAMVAKRNGALEGFWFSANMRPPMLGPSSLAAMRLRARGPRAGAAPSGALAARSQGPPRSLPASGVAVRVSWCRE
jgi:hypothetical protein